MTNNGSKDVGETVSGDEYNIGEAFSSAADTVERLNYSLTALYHINHRRSMESLRRYAEENNR